MLLFEQRDDVVRAQRSQRHTLDRGNSVKIGEQLRQRMTATDLRVAVGAEHEDRLIGE